MAEATNRQQQAEDKVLSMFGGKPAGSEDAGGEGDETPPKNDQQAPAGDEQAGAERPAAGDAQGAEAAGQGDDDATPGQPEEVEVEIEGERYLVPQKIADRFITHADYTRKTMELAEMRRSTAGEREALMIEKAFDQAVANERNEAAMLDAQIAQYRRVDWQALETDQLLKAKAQLDNLRERRAEIEASIKAKRSSFDDKLKSVAQEVKASGQKYIEQRLPKFDDKAKASLFAYGLNEGYTRDEMENLVDPRLVVSLWKAHQWDALQASKPGITKKAQQAAPTIRPGASNQRLTRVQQMGKAIKVAKGPEAKKRATEDYFAAKFGG